MDCSMPGLPVYHQLPEFTQFMSIQLVMPSNHLILCHPLLLLPSIFPSNRVFSNESVLCIRWPKYWSFSFNVSPSNKHSGLISLRMDWFDLLAVQGTLKSLLQHHSPKTSILWCSAFFIIQLSHPYLTTGKTIALTRHAGSQHGSFHPWQRSCREAWYAKASQDSRGSPWTCLSIYPKTRICLFYYFTTFTNSSDINKGLSPTTFSLKKINLEL